MTLKAKSWSINLEQLAHNITPSPSTRTMITTACHMVSNGTNKNDSTINPKTMTQSNIQWNPMINAAINPERIKVIWAKSWCNSVANQSHPGHPINHDNSSQQEQPVPSNDRNPITGPPISITNTQSYHHWNTKNHPPIWSGKHLPETAYRDQRPGLAPATFCTPISRLLAFLVTNKMGLLPLVLSSYSLENLCPPPWNLPTDDSLPQYPTAKMAHQSLHAPSCKYRPSSATIFIWALCILPAGYIELHCSQTEC